MVSTWYHLLLGPVYVDDLQTDQITYVLPVLMKENSPTTSSTLWPFSSHWGEGAGNAPGGWLAAPETQGEIAETIYIILRVVNKPHK